MPLTPRLSSNFLEEAFQLIKGGEGFEPAVYGDPLIGVPTIGYGYALIVKSSQGYWYVKPTLTADFAALGITLTAAGRKGVRNLFWPIPALA